MNARRAEYIAVPGVPMIQPGDDLPALIVGTLQAAALTPIDGDALIVTSKIVAKAEGRYIDLASVEPGDEAARLAAVTNKDPRIVELVLRESVGVSRAAPGVLVTRHRLGFVSANAGIDQSNIADGEARTLLLPIDPDASADRIRAAIETVFGARVGVVISDSHGRPFRMGNVGVAIGVAGMPALLDQRGQPDLFGRALKITITGYADMVASAAALLTGEADEGLPLVLARGLRFPAIAGRASEFVRPAAQDLYK